MSETTPDLGTAWRLLDEARAELDKASDRAAGLVSEVNRVTAERDSARKLADALERITTASARGMYCAWIDCQRGDPKAAAMTLSEGIDGFDGTPWNHTETGTEWWERTKAEEGLADVNPTAQDYDNAAEILKLRDERDRLAAELAIGWEEAQAAELPDDGQWLCIAFMGHLEYTGYVTEITKNGQPAYRVDLPEKIWGGNPLAYVTHAASSWFSDRPVTEESVRKAWEAQQERAARRAREEAEWRQSQEQRALAAADDSDEDDEDDEMEVF